MDEATSRGRSSGRRMASARPASTTRTGRTSKRTGQDPDAEISPARWAGVALVIAALLGAMVLAVVSPSVPALTQGTAVVPGDATPTPDPSASLDTRLPTVIPEITGPASGMVTDEWYVDIDAAISGERLPRKDLALVVLRGGDVVAEKARPRRKGNDVVTDVRLVEGTNELSVALRGPGGLGPASASIEVIMDRSAPHLEVTSPANRARTIEDVIEVVGTSEVGAAVQVTNEAKDFESAAYTVGPDGSFSFLVPLERGRNEIVAASTNATGRPQERTIAVTRRNGKPSVKIKAPATLKSASLPKTIRVVVDVKDANGDPLAGAPVSFGMQGVGRLADQGEGVTSEKGRATWPVEIKAGGNDPVEVFATVTSPSDESRTVKHQIAIK